ncbi:MAG TPA: OmpA family protein, partial [Pseudomonas sp.]|nr:OmpA family protein [Pseudomonas sp.]
GRNGSTFANLGGGAKYYFTENFYARAGVEAQYNIDQGDTEWAPSVGIGLNFGGGSKPAPVAEPVAEVVQEEVAPTPEPAENVRVELDVKFDFDKSVVKEESYGDIKNLADFMNQYPQTNTTVEGHTDSVGTDAYNQKLSERRANAVREVLVNQYGVGSERVGSVGYGESQPVADNATEAGRAVNRRVEAEVEAQAQ